MSEGTEKLVWVNIASQQKGDSDEFTNVEASRRSADAASEP